MYGRTTGVGANRSTAVEPGIDADLGMLRSHATSSGAPLDARLVRAGMIVRLNQVLRGGSGLHPDVVPALVSALALEATPVLHDRGGIGTGDLGFLGELALALLGEAPFSDGVARALWRPHPGDALPILSSNAVTAATAALALAGLRTLAVHEECVEALSLVAMRGSREALAEPVGAARPHPGVPELLARQRSLVAASEHTPTRIQDSYGLRAFAQVGSTLRTAADALEATLAVELNCAPENPLVDAPNQDVYHHGNFHSSALAIALDAVKIALYSDAALALSRLTDLSSPETTGLSSFLGAGAAGANGVMLLEYNAAAALAMLRHESAPASLGSIVISRGVENHSSFATQAAQQLLTCIGLATDVLACEALAAHRALHMHDTTLRPGSELRRYDDQLTSAVDPDLDDRVLTQDLAAVRALLTAPHPRK